jgi:signal transduction histidine kinase
MLEDRARIARNLHDQVIQRLFVTGLGLQGIASDQETGPGPHRAGDAGLLAHAAGALEGPLDTLVSSALADDVLSVLRESLSNALKYSQAGVVEVQLAAHDQLSLTVKDDGVGLPADPERRGLLYMQERAERLSGSCRIESAPGRGTTIIWTAPLD